MATNHLTINIGTDRQGTYEALTALAQKLGCRITDLAWLGIEGVLQNAMFETPDKTTIGQLVVDKTAVERNRPWYIVKKKYDETQPERLQENVQCN